DVSHQIIEEFMLSANEAVAEHLDSLGVPFLRRIHPAPEPKKLLAFAGFARILGYKIQHATDRFALQRILEQSADKPDAYAVHYALLRSRSRRRTARRRKAITPWPATIIAISPRPSGVIRTSRSIACSA